MAGLVTRIAGAILPQKIFYAHYVDRREVRLWTSVGDHVHCFAALVAKNAKHCEQHDWAAMHSGRTVKQHLGIRINQRIQSKTYTFPEQGGGLRKKIVLTTVPENFDFCIIAENRIVEFLLHVHYMRDAGLSQQKHILSSSDAATYRQPVRD